MGNFMPDFRDEAQQKELAAARQTVKPHGNPSDIKRQSAAELGDQHFERASAEQAEKIEQLDLNEAPIEQNQDADTWNGQSKCQGRDPRCLTVARTVNGAPTESAVGLEEMHAASSNHRELALAVEPPAEVTGAHEIAGAFSDGRSRRATIGVRELPRTAYLESLGWQVREKVRKEKRRHGSDTTFQAFDCNNRVYTSRGAVRKALLEHGIPWFKSEVDGIELSMIRNFGDCVPKEMWPPAVERA